MLDIDAARRVYHQIRQECLECALASGSPADSLLKYVLMQPDSSSDIRSSRPSPGIGKCFARCESFAQVHETLVRNEWIEGGVGRFLVRYHEVESSQRWISWDGADALEIIMDVEADRNVHLGDAAPYWEFPVVELAHAIHLNRQSVGHRAAICQVMGWRRPLVFRMVREMGVVALGLPSHLMADESPLQAAFSWLPPHTANPPDHQYLVQRRLYAFSDLLAVVTQGSQCYWARLLASMIRGHGNWRNLLQRMP